MRFILSLLVLVLLITALPAPAVQAQAPVQQMRAFWVDSLNPGFHNHPQVDELVANVKRAGANTIIVQVRRHGDAWYNNAIEPRAADPRLAPAAEFDPLGYLLARAHEEGLRVHAWLVVSVVCRTSDRLWGHPDHVCTAHGPRAQGTARWTTATYAGQQVGDFDFGHPEAIIHTERVVEHLLRAYPALDGIHWDYIRFGGQSYGYNQVSVERFNRATGRPLNSRPAPGDPAWSQWRRDRVTELARRLYIRSKAIKPSIEVSAAAITWGSLGNDGNWGRSSAYSTVFQDWPAWLAEGIIDVAIPMHYFAEGVPRSREWYDGWLAFDRANTGRRTIVAGIGSWLNTPEQNISQVARALTPDEQGRVLSGVAFFSYAGAFAGSNDASRRAFMDQLRATVFAQPARAPDWPWIVAPTAGHLQGMAAIDGVLTPDARVTLIHEGAWLRDLTASADGWFGAVELPPGNYTVVVTQNDRQHTWHNVVVRPGLVTSL
ncbi:family 10 glycosylhydrolase [Candidatus Chloroploca sp. M-50]|uniref:Family 10 glycosylhydrolase n=1 Tax=Candidatus Chloroploca mongolica TaxID=2528176 RepID=A0ABS4D4X3_9CHLR|nr:family 10 glycosylhydrolase [Candidatus Chloroploca mongolica]MBP1464481.1 family 10 glycosylhydrolase [Candidatus Chloroploca mongolica]